MTKTRKKSNQMHNLQGWQSSTPN